MNLYREFSKYLSNWLMQEPPRAAIPPCDFERIRYEVRPCDVLLIEGKSRVSEVIKLITQSAWSHAALYIGRLHDIDDPELRRYVQKHYDGPEDEQLLIEGMMGRGTICVPITAYQNDHVRICRPRGISRRDAQKVVGKVISGLGVAYDTRQIFDMARFFFPWFILPRRWRSTLFSHNAGENTKTVCSTLIAEAFSSVRFPILPLVKANKATGIELIPLNPKLFTPKDFDYSPYFDIIKYPYVQIAEHGNYRSLPWNQEGYYSHGEEDVFMPSTTPASENKHKRSSTD